jgi:hypothetical protein
MLDILFLLAAWARDAFFDMWCSFLGTSVTRSLIGVEKDVDLGGSSDWTAPNGTTAWTPSPRVANDYPTAKAWIR